MAQVQIPTGIRPLTELPCGRLHTFLLGYPMLAVVLLHAFYFTYMLLRLLMKRFHTAALGQCQAPAGSMDLDWLPLTLPIMFIPTGVAVAYLTWMGWMFFQRN